VGTNQRLEKLEIFEADRMMTVVNNDFDEVKFSASYLLHLA